MRRTKLEGVTRGALVCVVCTAALLGCSDDSSLKVLELSGRFEPDTVDFGEVAIGRPEVRTVALLNTGVDSLTIDELQVPEGFTVEGAKDLNGQTLPPNAQLDIDVRFAPMAEATFAGTLRVVSADVDIDLALRGEGVFRPLSRLSVSPTTIDFGTVAVADTTSSQVVLTNTGNAEAVIQTAIPRDPATFSIGRPLPIVIPVGGTEVVQVVFSPQEARTYTDTMEFIAGDDRVELDLQGEAIDPDGSVLCDPARVAFGDVARGERAVVSVTCTARGGPARITRVRIREGADVGFGLLDPFASPIDLGPNQSTQLRFTFDADGLPGERTGFAEIEYSGGTAVVLELELSGATVAPQAGDSDITLVLRWDALTDVDIHLVRPGGVFFMESDDCYFASRTPDWGVLGATTDNPFLDQDNVTGFGPETINLGEAAPGRYQVWAHYYAGPVALPSTASVEVFFRGMSVGTYHRTLRCQRRWLVGFIEWNGSTGTFLPDDFESNYRAGECR